MHSASQRTIPIVVGIDVGGPSKGFHAVALEDGRYRDQLATGKVEELVCWSVQEMGAAVIAIDAPYAWSTDGHGRPSEGALMKKKIWCFSTPLQAVAHAKPFYSWMLRGMELYETLETTHPVRDPRSPGREHYCIETFPHAITWHLQGGSANAKKKRDERRALLDLLGIDRTALTNIDKVDAALCAYTAHLAATGAPLQVFGEEATGLIIVPRWAAVAMKASSL